MRIVITGATGNVGTAVVRALAADPQVDEILGLARRVPSDWHPAKTTWASADVARDDLRPHFAGADAVIHLAWLIQPSRQEAITEQVNVEGSARVFAAAVEAGVGALVHASSVAAYGPADPGRPVDESYPTTGIASSYYSRQKVAVERTLDDVELANPGLRVVRLRPGLIFQRSAASEIRRFFAGPLLPGWVVRQGLIPLVPDLEGLAGQVVHSDDVADAYRRAVLDPEARGAYNIAAAPPLDGPALGRLLGARPVRLPRMAVRSAVALSWRARIHPVSPGWLDVGTSVPIMQTDRAQSELGWTPRHAAGAVVQEILEGLREGAGYPTPPLEPRAGGLLRWREFATGIGGPNPLDRESAAQPR